MSNDTKTWWNYASKFYQEESKIPVDIHYGPGAPNEEELKLLGNLKGKKVLEIGCGGAQCGIAMAKQGAIVTGMDISEEQLKFASELAKNHKVKINLIQGDITNLSPIKSNSQDIVFTAWALHYVDNLLKCFKEAYRVLKKNKYFVLALPHPFSRIIDNETLKIKDSYFHTGKYEKAERDEGNEKKQVFVMYNYTFSQVANDLMEAGFKIEKIIEPDSRKRYKGDPWYGIWEFTPNLLNNVPTTLIFKVRK